MSAIVEGMQSGDKVRIKTKDGKKVKGVITQFRVDRDCIGAPGEQVPGRTMYTLTIVLEGPPR